MKTCPKCGNVIQNDNARFCKECGTDLYGNNDGGIWLGDPQDPTPSTPPKNKGGFSIAKIGIIAAAVITLLIILLFAFSGSDETPEATSTETEVISKPKETTAPKKTAKPVKRDTTSMQTQTSAKEEVVEPKSVAPPSEVETSDDSQKKRLSTALGKEDYKQVQILANEGYAPAYVPLAKYYLSNNDYDDADRYAKKAKAAGQSGAQSIITTLENLGYYD